MATCTLTGTIVDPAGTAISNVTVKFNIARGVTDGLNQFVVPKEQSVVTNTLGVFTLTLDQGLSGVLAVEYPPNAVDMNQRLSYAITIPATASATFPGIITEF